MTQPEKFDLEAFFEDARATPPQISQDLAARIAADAQAQMPRQRKLLRLWQRILGGIGGPAGFGGLVTATAVGFWFGVAPPADAMDPLVLLGAVEVMADEDVTDLTGFGLSGFVLENDEG